MPTKRMLVDAIHPEETRVVVTNGNRLEEFDFESATRRQLRGNIYLAKVTRVEPSLQAAFVDYGGNRHGFLAFSEIHPDYYQIPLADREALLAEEEEEVKEDLSDLDQPAMLKADGDSTSLMRTTQQPHLTMMMTMATANSLKKSELKTRWKKCQSVSASVHGPTKFKK